MNWKFPSIIEILIKNFKNFQINDNILFIISFNIIVLNKFSKSLFPNVLNLILHSNINLKEISKDSALIIISSYSYNINNFKDFYYKYNNSILIYFVIIIVIIK